MSVSLFLGWSQLWDLFPLFFGDPEAQLLTGNLEGRQTLFRQTLFRQMLFRQSAARPSTSLARLAYVEIVEIGKQLEWVEALDASKARHWSRHWGDWGEQSLGRVSQWVWGAPSSGKVTTYFHTIVLPLIFGIWFDIFPISTARRA